MRVDQRGRVTAADRSKPIDQLPVFQFSNANFWFRVPPSSRASIIPTNRPWTGFRLPCIQPRGGRGESQPVSLSFRRKKRRRRRRRRKSSDVIKGNQTMFITRYAVNEDLLFQLACGEKIWRPPLEKLWKWIFLGKEIITYRRGIIGGRKIIMAHRPRGICFILFYFFSFFFFRERIQGVWETFVACNWIRCNF